MIGNTARKKMWQKIRYIQSDNPEYILEEIVKHYTRMRQIGMHSDLMRQEPRRAKRLRVHSRSVLKAIEETPRHEVIRLILDLKKNGLKQRKP